MKGGTFPSGALWRWATTLLVALTTMTGGAVQVAAVSLGDYFTYSYDVQFSRTSVARGETFSAAVAATATCINNLPLPVTQAQITGRIAATHQESGARVTLNPSYTVTVSPFPTQQGQRVQISQTVALQFPEGSPAGAYNVIAELIEARVLLSFIPLGVTQYLPPSQMVGAVVYTAMIAGIAGGGASALPPVPSATTPVTGSGTARWTPAAGGTTPASISVTSMDSMSSVTLRPGTLALDRQGNPLTSITCEPPATIPPAPPNGKIIAIYELGPSGATFGAPVSVTMKYDPGSLPQGVSESSLVLAYYNEPTSTWTQLDNVTVDTSSRTVSGTVTHFTQFAVLAASRSSVAPGVAPSPAPAPADALTPALPAAVPNPQSAPPPPPSPEPSPRMLLVGLAAAIFVLGLAACIYLAVRRRRTPGGF